MNDDQTLSRSHSTIRISATIDVQLNVIHYWLITVQSKLTITQSSHPALRVQVVTR